MLRFNRLAVAAVTAVFLSSFAVVASALILDRSGTINGCISPAGLRVSDSGASCNRTEVSLNSEQAAPTGPTGAASSTGPASSSRSPSCTRQLCSDVRRRGTRP
jgi:hypothetical protein